MSGDRCLPAVAPTINLESTVRQPGLVLTLVSTAWVLGVLLAVEAGVVAAVVAVQLTWSAAPIADAVPVSVRPRYQPSTSGLRFEYAHRRVA